MINHPAVAACPACFSHVAAQMRPYDDIQPGEWAAYEKAKRTTDPKKLAALLPAWIKAHMRAVAPPKPFVYVPDPEPVFPAWTRDRNIGPTIRAFPGLADANAGVAAYIAAFEYSNGHKPAAYEFRTYPAEVVAMAA